VTFGAFLVAAQLTIGAVIGLIAAALAIWSDNNGLVAVLTAGSTTFILIGLIMATTSRRLAAYTSPEPDLDH
jgi:hypothetical protein